jgi:hypothetical protein
MLILIKLYLISISTLKGEGRGGDAKRCVCTIVVANKEQANN